MAKTHLSDLVYPELKTTGRLEITGRATPFHIWRHKLDFALADKKVKYVLTDPVPDQESDPIAHKKFLDDDLTAQTTILFSLNDFLLESRNEKHDTAKSLLDDLTTTFTKPSMSCRMVLLHKYLDRKMFEETPVKEHVLSMKAMAKELELEGVKIPDDFQAVVLINSLPDSWKDAVERMVVNIDSGSEGASLENVENRVRATGGWKESCKAISEDDGDVDGSARGAKCARRGGPFRGKCHGCGEFGHRKFNCPN